MAEKHNVAGEHSELVARLTGELAMLVEQGASRKGLKVANDTCVRFDIIQERRWAPAASAHDARQASK